MRRSHLEARYTASHGASRSYETRLDILEQTVIAIAGEQEAVMADIGEIVKEVDATIDWDTSALAEMTKEGDELTKHEIISSLTAAAGNVLDGGGDEVDAAEEEGEAASSAVEAVPVAGPVVDGIAKTVLKGGRGLFDAAVGIAKVGVAGYQAGSAVSKLADPPDYGGTAVMKNIVRLKERDAALHAALEGQQYLRAKIATNLGIMHHGDILDDVHGRIPGPVIEISILHPSIAYVAKSRGVDRGTALARIASFLHVDGLKYRILTPHGVPNEYYVSEFYVYFEPGKLWAKITGIRHSSVMPSGTATCGVAPSSTPSDQTIITRLPYTQSLTFMNATMIATCHHVLNTVIPWQRDGVTKQNVAAMIFGALMKDAEVPLTNHLYSVGMVHHRSAESLREYFKALRYTDHLPERYGRREYNITEADVETATSATANTITNRTPLINQINQHLGTSHSGASSVGTKVQALYAGWQFIGDGARPGYDAALA
jgi:hypothetical protein